MFKYILLFALFVCSPAFSDSYWGPHWQSRDATVSSNVSLLGQGDVVLLGDSNTEMFWWNQNAGCQLVNAGYGGARVSDLVPRALWLAPLARPKLVHIMLGTNDLPYADATHLSQLTADLRNIIQQFKAVGSHVVVWPIPPVAADYPAAANRDVINNAVQVAAGAEGVNWDWWWPRQITTGGAESGPAAPGALIGDGVHLSSSSQTSRYYRLETWRSYLGIACS